MADAVVTRADFEAELRRLGYRAAEAYDHDPCKHVKADGYAVFVMPMLAFTWGAKTFGDLGWLVYEGCVECCKATTHVMLCGGIFTHLRVFEHGVLTESFGNDDEIRPAAESAAPQEEEEAEDSDDDSDN